MKKSKATPKNQSAGLLLYRRKTSGVEVLLAHPGGPFWQRKDEGAWAVPKGLISAGEAPLLTLLAGDTNLSAVELGALFRVA